MKMQRTLLLLTVVNRPLLVIELAQLRTASAVEEIAPVLRGRALQIVDDRGRIRASINVYSAGSQGDDASGATVLLRLITDRGRPSVKIAASEQQAVMALVGPTGTKETYVQLGAKGRISSVIVKNEDGRERVLEP